MSFIEYNSMKVDIKDGFAFGLFLLWSSSFVSESVVADKKYVNIARFDLGQNGVSIRSVVELDRQCTGSYKLIDLIGPV
jgi:hypothetical protein